MQPDLKAIQAAMDVVYAGMAPTPQYRWPLLCERLGTDVWVKHENHTPLGAFKIRGGLVYFSHYRQTDVLYRGVISATRGNHGQSLAYAAGLYDVPATVVVPEGNSREKNAAMEALGANVVVKGEDFQASRELAADWGRKRGWHLMPAFHPLLVAGVATYGYELFQAVPDLDVVYVPIGLGSGICGMVAARDALGLSTRIVGVVSAHARAYAESFAAGKVVESPAETRLADGIACRSPDPDALDIILRGVERIVTVTDDDVADAMRMLFECTHNVCEGAGAAATAAAVQDRSRLAGLRVAVVASGGNVDRTVFASVLAAT